MARKKQPTREQRLEKKGWKISVDRNSGNAFAKKGSRTVKASSITKLHEKIIGY